MYCREYAVSRIHSRHLRLAHSQLIKAAPIAVARSRVPSSMIISTNSATAGLECSYNVRYSQTEKKKLTFKSDDK